MEHYFKRKQRLISEMETWLRKKRAENNIYCSQLATALGVSIRQYYNLESGEREMTEEQLRSLSKLYHENLKTLKELYHRDKILKAAGWNEDPEAAVKRIQELNNFLKDLL